MKRAAAFAALFFLAAPVFGAGFFDGVPSKGYVIDDVSLDVLSATGGTDPIARLRYVRLSLDPGRRDIAYDFWPQREMLMVERATGEKVIFERLLRLQPGADPSAWSPRGRVGLEGSALETFARTAGAQGPCGALDVLIRAGNVDLPVSSGDLSVRTVRLGVAQAVETAVSERGRELVASAVPILYAATTKGLPAPPLDMLNLLFPGRAFARSAEGLTFRQSAGAPLDPAGGAWRSVTSAPLMLPGTPVF